MTKRARWTILNVNEEVIKLVKKNSKKKNFTTAGSLEDLILKGANAKTS